MYAVAVLWTETTGLAHWLVDALSMMVLGVSIGRVVWAKGLIERRPWLVAGLAAAIAVVAGAAIAASMADYLRLTPYLPVALSSLIVAAIFARGLRPGRRPVILQLIDVMGIGPEASPEFRAYARRQSVAWVMMSLVTAAAAVAGMFSPGLRGWADVGVPILAAVQLAWFVISHNIGMYRYGRPESWRDTLQAMSRLQTWTALEV